MMTQDAPVACTLTAANFRSRMSWIGDLARDGMQDHRQDGLTLHLTYDRTAIDRVRQMAITAREAEREAANMLFQQFVTSSPHIPTCQCV